MQQRALRAPRSLVRRLCTASAQKSPLLRDWYAQPLEQRQKLSEEQKRQWFVDRAVAADDGDDLLAEAKPIIHRDGHAMPSTSPQTASEDVNFISSRPYSGPRKWSNKLGGIYVHSKMGVPTVTVSGELDSQRTRLQPAHSLLARQIPNSQRTCCRASGIASLMRATSFLGWCETSSLIRSFLLEASAGRKCGRFHLLRSRKTQGQWWRQWHRMHWRWWSSCGQRHRTRAAAG